MPEKKRGGESGAKNINMSNLCLAELFFSPTLYENCNPKQGLSALSQ